MALIFNPIVGILLRRYFGGARRQDGFSIAPLFGGLLLLIATARSVLAQEALRYSLAGEAAARAAAQSLQDHPYNLRLGDARFTADASLSLELNDNVALSGTSGNNQEDLILRPLASTRVFWPVTEKNAFDFTLGLGYVKYVQHSQYDYVLISPGSSLAFNLFVGDFRFTFFDRFAYSEDPLQNPTISGVANYGGLDNSAGVNALWDLNQAVVDGSFVHQNFVPSNQQFDYLNRASELLLVKSGFRVLPNVVLGPEASASWTTYASSFLDNAISYSGGGFVRSQITPYITGEAHVGYVAFQFEGRQGQAVDNPATYYFNLGLQHRLNQYISQSISGGRQLTLGFYSNFQETYSVQYAITWRILRDLGLVTQFYYDHSTYPPVLVSSVPGAPVISTLGETFDSYGPSVSLTYQLMQKLSSSLTYRYTVRDSNTSFFGFTQNALTLGFNYRF